MKMHSYWVKAILSGTVVKEDEVQVHVMETSVFDPGGEGVVRCTEMVESALGPVFRMMGGKVEVEYRGETDVSLTETREGVSAVLGRTDQPFPGVEHSTQDVDGLIAHVKQLEARRKARKESNASTEVEWVS